MITTLLMGGLGNQMFQYAAARRLAIHHGTGVELDLSWFDRQAGNETISRYEIDCFGLEPSIAAPTRIPSHLDRRIRRLGSAVLGQGRNPRMRQEKSFAFDPSILEASSDAYLTGYWQSEKYFIDVADTIRQDFTFRSPAEASNAELLAEINACNAVSIHVRRADYVTGPTTSKVHGTMPLNYYRKGIDIVTEGLPDPRFFIFSDEPQWCEQNIRSNFPTTYVSGNIGRGSEDMRLMMNCKRHIIANSSFSWWGAWLDPNPTKIVVAPRQWFKDRSRDERDLLPETWIRI